MWVSLEFNEIYNSFCHSFCVCVFARGVVKGPQFIHSDNLGVISSKDKQIKATLLVQGHFIKTSYPQSGHKQTSSQLICRSTLKQRHKVQMRVSLFSVLWSNNPLVFPVKDETILVTLRPHSLTVCHGSLSVLHQCSDLTETLTGSLSNNGLTKTGTLKTLHFLTIYTLNVYFQLSSTKI